MSRLQGAITALVTPFNEDESIDYGALKNLIDYQLNGGISAILPMGTTGESPTVTLEENEAVIKFVVENVKGKIPVIAGSGSNCTAEAIRMTKNAKSFGADYALIVAPYYNKPSQEGFYKHFMTIADSCDIPILIYNIPGRTGKNIETQTIAKLSKHPLIVGVKEASGSIAQAMDVKQSVSDDFLLFSGDDGLTLPTMALGGDGIISVASNIIPAKMEQLVKYALNNQYNDARKLNYELYDFFKAIFIDTNPIPIKYALSKMGLIKEVYRLPMCKLSDTNKVVIDNILKTIL